MIPHPTSRELRRIALATTAALTMTAAPALASEGTTGAPLPNPLAPVVFTPAGPAANAPGGSPAAGKPARKRAARPRITKARMTPRRVAKGHRARLRVSLAAPASVRVVLERKSHGRTVRVKTFNVAAAGRNVSLRLPARLTTGSYRLRIVAIDAEGTRSRESRRLLSITR